MAEKISKILSPCISICQYDENGTCFGCLRTLKGRKKWKKPELVSLLKKIYNVEIKCKEHYNISNTIFNKFLLDTCSKNV